MTAQVITGVPTITTATDAWFRGFKTFSDALTALGITKTADTGQVDWTTVTVKGSGVFTDYEIRRLNDSAQATHPLFIKISYGRNTISSVQWPGITIEVGTGSNSSGALTGQIGPLRTFLMSGSTATVGNDWAVSSDGSGFAVIAGMTNSVRLWMTLERLRGVDGDSLPGQFILAKNSNTANPTGGDVQSFHYDTVRNIVNIAGVSVGYNNAISVSNSTLFTMASGKYPFAVLSLPTEEGRGYSKLFVGYAFGDFLHTTEFDLTRFNDNEVCRYRCHKSVVVPYAFGLTDSSTSIGSATNPTTYGTPAIYWE